MSGLLKLIGIINAAIWFGAAIFFAAAVLPAVFSHDMRQVFQENAYPYYSGAVALILFRRFFVVQYICGTVAVLHLLAERFYSGRALPRAGTALVAALFGLSLIGGLWLEPHMEHLRQTKYLGATQEIKEDASRSFGIWHGISELVNLFVLSGLLAHLVLVVRPAGPVRYGNYYQIPG